MVLEPVIDVIFSLQNEIVIFVLAIIVHALFYGNILPRKSASSKTSGFVSATHGCKTQVSGYSDKERTIRRRPDGNMPGDISPSFRSLTSRQETLLEIERAHGSGDVRTVLRCWNGIRSKNVELEPQHVIMAVQSMKRLRIDSDSIARGVQCYLKHNVSTLGNVNYVNEILESVAKSLDMSLVDSLVQGLEELSIKPDSRTFEILIQMHFSVRSFKDIETLDRRMAAQGLEPTARTSLSLLKTALHAKDISAVLRHYTSFQGASATPMPAHLEVQVVELASREGCLGDILAGFESGAVRCCVEVLNTLLRRATEDSSTPWSAYYARNRATDTMDRPPAPCGVSCDGQISERIFRMACKQAGEKNGTTYELLLRKADGDVETTRQICQDLLTLGSAEYVRNVASQLLGALDPATDVALADKLFELSREDSRMHTSTVSSLVRFYGEAGEDEKACDIYVKHLRPQPSEAITRMLNDTKTRTYLINAALTCSKHEILAELLEVASPVAKTKCIDAIRVRLAKGDVELPDKFRQSLHKYRGHGRQN